MGEGGRRTGEGRFTPANPEGFRGQLLEKLINLQYNRNDITFERGQFRVCGDNGKKLFRSFSKMNSIPTAGSFK
ncbi:MAG: hypothetical protein AAB380_01915 [Verrucomicrobiota bacterium]